MKEIIKDVLITESGITTEKNMMAIYLKATEQLKEYNLFRSAYLKDVEIVSTNAGNSPKGEIK